MAPFLPTGHQAWPTPCARRRSGESDALPMLSIGVPEWVDTARASGWGKPIWQACSAAPPTPLTLAQDPTTRP